MRTVFDDHDHDDDVEKMCDLDRQRRRRRPRPPPWRWIVKGKRENHSEAQTVQGELDAADDDDEPNRKMGRTTKFR